MKNEIEQAQDLQNMEILKSFIPSWMNSELEPLLTSPQDDLTAPTWNKFQWDFSATGDSGGGSGNESTLRGIMVVNGVARYVFFPGSLDGIVT